MQGTTLDAPVGAVVECDHPLNAYGPTDID